MNILIIHDILESFMRYNRIKMLLEGDGHFVTVYNLPGFTDRQPIREEYLLPVLVEEISEIILEKQINLVIAQGVGCGILLRCMENINCDIGLILMSPIYCKKSSHYLKHAKVLNTLKFNLWKKNKIGIKHKWCTICEKWDEIIYEDIVRSDATTVIQLLREVADNWHLEGIRKNKVLVILGEQDEVVDQGTIKDLRLEFPNMQVRYIFGCKYTPIIDAFLPLRREVGEFIKDLSNDI